MARSCASASSGTSPEQKSSVRVAPAERHEATHKAFFPGWEVAGRLVYRLAVVGPEEL